MLPKKGRKEITVDNVLYHYVIKGYVRIIIRNSVTSKITEWYEDYKPKWKIQVKPSDVAEIIRKVC